MTIEHEAILAALNSAFDRDLLGSPSLNTTAANIEGNGENFFDIFKQATDQPNATGSISGRVVPVPSNDTVDIVSALEADPFASVFLSDNLYTDVGIEVRPDEVVLVLTPGGTVSDGVSLDDLDGGDGESTTPTDGDDNLNVVGGEAVYGRAGDDTITGGSDANEIYGNQGDDALSGGAGDDRLFGGQDNDSVAGGADEDLVYGNLGTDTLHGGQGQDSVFGGQGNDSVTGGADNDVVYGNLGSDSIDGGIGSDVVYGNQGDDMLFGGAGSDMLFGGQGDDMITGGPGADTLIGGAGDDTLVGGGGNDTYVVTDGNTTINDDGAGSIVPLDDFFGL